MQPPDLSSLMTSRGRGLEEKRFVRSEVMRSEERTRMMFTGGRLAQDLVHFKRREDDELENSATRCAIKS